LLFGDPASQSRNCAPLDYLWQGRPLDRRNKARVRGFLARSHDQSWVNTHPEHLGFIEAGEDLLAELAAHPRAGELVKALFQNGYGICFDVRAKTAAPIARLDARAARLPDPTALRNRLRELSDLCEQAIREWKDIIELLKDRAGGWYAAWLGDAATTIRVLSEPPHNSKIPFVQKWLTEAREKLQRQSG